MLGLVFTHRHQLSLVEQDVGGHKDRVAEQRQARVLVLLRSLLLELDHFVKPAQWGQSRQEPHHLSMCSDIRLHKQGALLGVDATGDQCSCGLEGQLLWEVLLPQGRISQCDFVPRVYLHVDRILPYKLLRDRVVVNDAVVSL